MSGNRGHICFPSKKLVTVRWEDRDEVCSTCGNLMGAVIVGGGFSYLDTSGEPSGESDPSMFCGPEACV